MEILLFNLSKRKNSTKRPVDTYGVAKSVTLKGECSYLNPSFFLGDITGYTYLKAWGNYYFIDRVAYDINGAQYINCSIDVLATWKEQIMATSAFVVYSSSDYSSLLKDDRVGMLTDVDIIVDNSVSSIFQTTPCYILSVVGEDGINCLLPIDPNVIPATLYQKQVTDLVSALCIQWSDAQACMLELKEVPLDLGADYSLDPAHIGKIDIGSRNAISQYFNSNLYEDDESIAIPSTYSDFRLFTFVSAHLYLPFIGVVEIDLEAFYPKPTSSGLIKIHTAANPLTGSVVYTLKNGYDEVIHMFSGSFGRTLPINASRPSDIVGAITHIISAASNIAAGKPEKGIPNIVNSMSDSVRFRGSKIGNFSGSFAEFAGTNFVLGIEKHNSRIDPSNLTDLVGRPCAKVVQIGTLTGYVETSGFSIDISAISEVKDMINQAMDKGIYLE